MASNKVVFKPTKSLYMDPTQRILKSEQIGPSSHKNEYHLGVLQGNWIEERASFDHKAVSVPLESVTINKASFQPHAAAPKLDPTPHSEVERSLIFGHGEDFSRSSFVTTNELFYAKAAGKGGVDGSTPLTVDKALSMASATSTRSTELADKKKHQWEAERDIHDRFVTVKNATIDASGAFAKDNKVYEKPHSRACSESSRSLDCDYRKIGLREPVPLSVSPLVQQP